MWKRWICTQIIDCEIPEKGLRRAVNSNYGSELSDPIVVFSFPSSYLKRRITVQIIWLLIYKQTNKFRENTEEHSASYYIVSLSLFQLKFCCWCNWIQMVTNQACGAWMNTFCISSSDWMDYLEIYLWKISIKYILKTYDLHISTKYIIVVSRSGTPWLNVLSPSPALED